MVEEVKEQIVVKKCKTRVRNETDPSDGDNGVSNFCLILELPISISNEIFLRLPVKSVLICKSVCKKWRDLISEPIFSDSYAERSIYTTLFRYSYSDSQLPYLLEISGNGICYRSPMQPKIPDRLKSDSSYYRIVGLCNGIVCVLVTQPVTWSPIRHNIRWGYEVVCVSNPIVGNAIQLPSHRWFDIYKDEAIYYFGFSPSTHKFKVLRVVFKEFRMDSGFKHDDDYKAKKCEIFTVGVDDRWRTLPIAFGDLHIYSNLIAFNGVFHWIPCVESPTFISTFEIAEEKLGETLAIPDIVLDRRNINLRIFDNQLALVDESDPSQISIWTMEKYPNVESWTRIIVQRSWFPLDVKMYSFRPVPVLRKGEILFGDCPENYLVSCNVKQRICTKIDICAAKNDWSLFTEAYAPSFFRHAGSL